MLLGFLKIPKEPVRLDTFPTPFVEEVTEFKNSGGAAMTCSDGISRKLQLHCIRMAGDSPEIKKTAGIVSENRKKACRDCEVEAYRSASSNHHYLPSKVSIPVSSENGRQRTLRLYDPDNLQMRTTDSVEIVLSLLDNSNISDSERVKLRRDTGIQRRTVLLSLPSLESYASFSLDIMHAFLNLCEGMIQV